MGLIWTNSTVRSSGRASPPRMIYFIRVAALQSNRLAIIRIAKCAVPETLMRHGLAVADFTEKKERKNKKERRRKISSRSSMMERGNCTCFLFPFVFLLFSLFFLSSIIKGWKQRKLRGLSENSVKLTLYGKSWFEVRLSYGSFVPLPIDRCEFKYSWFRSDGF